MGRFPSRRRRAFRRIASRKPHPTKLRRQDSAAVYFSSENGPISGRRGPSAIHSTSSPCCCTACPDTAPTDTYCARSSAGTRLSKQSTPAHIAWADRRSRAFSNGEDCHEPAGLSVCCIGWRCRGNTAEHDGCPGQSRHYEGHTEGRSKSEDHHP